MAVRAAVVALALAAMSAAAGAQDAIRIGYAISTTGPNALGAGITTLPNYQLWVRDVNAAGGIYLKSIGRRVPVTVVEYDDRSSRDEVMRRVRQLVEQDRVDFVLPPWGTGFNLAVGQILSDAGYPHLAVTAMTDLAPQFVRRWPGSFWLLGTSSSAAEALVDMLARLRAQGRIGERIALVSVADQFGIELATAARRALFRSDFAIVYDRAYPVGSEDMGPIVAEAMQADADTFLAFSYPPDTMQITAQAQAVGFNPAVFYTAVGTAYPVYRLRFGAGTDGVIGIGGVDPDSPGMRDYVRRHREFRGIEPDRWASPVTYASLEMLQQAIERVGRIDRAAVIRELRTGTFETVIGTVRLDSNIYRQGWMVGQWQDGDFHGVAPTELPGARPLIVPKPAWRKPD